MANKNFVVKNGLTVGSFTVDANSGNISTPGALSVTSIRTDNVLNSNGAPISVTGYTGSAGVGYTGSTGLGFNIAKQYGNVALLEADITPTGIEIGEFALINTGDVDDPENSRLYIWDGNAYTYVNDLSGAAGITGPAGADGYTGSAGADGTIGVDGYTGSQGTTGYVGSKGNTGSIGYTGSQGGSSFATGSMPPSSPALGDIWFNTTRNSILQFANVGLSTAWLELTGPKYSFGISSNVATSIYESGQVYVDYLIVAGGGGGGNGGGGGAGGLLEDTNISLTAGQEYLITVGAGGASYPSYTNGTASSFIGLTAIGGGVGGLPGTSGSAKVGGSGGGAGASSGASPTSGAAGTPGQGYGGGSSQWQTYWGGGGGGGANGSGYNGDTRYTNHGNGGVGRTSSITGSSVTYATGGAGSNGSSTPSIANSGNGGNTGGSGSSGTVIVRSLQQASVITGSYVVTQDGNYYAYKFTTSGSIIF